MACCFSAIGLAAFLWVVYFIALSISLTPDPDSRDPIFSQTQGSIIRHIVVPLMLAGFAGSIGLWEAMADIKGSGIRSSTGSSDPGEPPAISAFSGTRNVRVFEFALLPGIVYFLVWLAGWATAQYRSESPGPGDGERGQTLAGKGLGHLLFAILALGLGSLLVLISARLAWR